MLLMGDEVRRTQQGNNNAYCQDNEISWFDWNLCHRNADLLRFVRNVIRLRLNFNRGTKAGQITLEDHPARPESNGTESSSVSPTGEETPTASRSLCIISP